MERHEETMQGIGAYPILFLRGQKNGLQGILT